jgi:branched-chain amino acid transport system substrate-binding protein
VPHSQIDSHSQIDRRKILRLAGIGVGLAASSPILAACSSAASSGSPGSGGSTTSGSSGSGNTQLNIGFIEPATGPLAAGYGPLYAPASLAIQEINAAGGILGKKITSSVYNDQGNVADEGSAAHQLISAGQHYAIGPVGTSQVLASYAVTQTGGNQVIQCCETMSPTVNDPKRYPGGYSPIIQSEHAAQVFVDQLVNTLGRRKIGLLYENTGYGDEGANFFTQAVKGTPAKIAASGTYDVGSTTIQSSLLKLKSAGIDSLMLWCTTPGDVSNIFTAIQQLQLSVPIGASSTFATYLGKLIPKLSPTILNNTFLVVNSTFTFTPQQPASADVVDYATRLGQFAKIPGPVLFSAIQGPQYDFVYMLKRAIEAAKTTDFTAVTNALQTLGPYSGKVGTINFTGTDHVGLTDSSYALAKASGLLNESLSHGWMVERVS